MISRGAVELMGRMGSNPQSSTGPTRVLDRFDLYVDREDKSIAPHLIYDGFWEAWITTWVMNNVRAGSRCIDVGANQGYYAMLLASMECEVMAIEPIKKYVEMIETSAMLNDVYIETVHSLVGDREGMETFYELEGLTGSSSVYHSTHPQFTVKNTTFVKMRTLDQMTVGRKIDFIKIDVEGAEARVWSGMRNLRLNNQDLVTLMEFTPSESNAALAKELVTNWDTRYVDFAGNEQVVESAEWLNVQPDFLMLVIRRKG